MRRLGASHEERLAQVRPRRNLAASSASTLAPPRPLLPANAAAGGGDLTGVRVWEAAPPLIEYISCHRAQLLAGRSVLELGAGTGAVGLAAAAFGARQVVLSDGMPCEWETPRRDGHGPRRWLTCIQSLGL